MPCAAYGLLLRATEALALAFACPVVAIVTALAALLWAVVDVAIRLVFGYHAMNSFNTIAMTSGSRPVLVAICLEIADSSTASISSRLRSPMSRPHF